MVRSVNAGDRAIDYLRDIDPPCCRSRSALSEGDGRDRIQGYGFADPSPVRDPPMAFPQASQGHPPLSVFQSRHETAAKKRAKGG